MRKSLLQLKWRGVKKKKARASGFVCPPHLRLFLVRVLGRGRGEGLVRL